jgi:hypothetical protein
MEINNEILKKMAVAGLSVVAIGAAATGLNSFLRPTQETAENSIPGLPVTEEVTVITFEEPIPSLPARENVTGYPTRPKINWSDHDPFFHACFTCGMG